MLPVILILVLSLHRTVASAASASQMAYDIPYTCLKPRECPEYKVVAHDADKNFEIRVYDAAEFATAQPQESESYRKAVSAGFTQLFSYFRGRNNRKQNITMTAPVITMISPMKGNSSSHVTYFYLPKAVQNDPPLADDIKIVKWLNSTKMAAVRRYGGFNTDFTIAKELVALRASLKGGLWDMQSKIMDYAVAGYNNPFVQHNRTNEVMLLFSSNAN